MTTDKEARLAQLEAKEAKKALSAKKYFAKRGVREDFYKSFFDKHANAQDKKDLENALSNVKL